MILRRCIALVASTALVLATQWAFAAPANADIVEYPSNMLGDGAFERQSARAISAPWYGEGPDYKGIDINLGYARRGTNNAFIRTASRNWNAVAQRVSVRPNTKYRVTAWIRSSANMPGYMGARSADGTRILGETSFGLLNPYQRVTADFHSGANTSVVIFVGYHAPGVDSWIQVDDVYLGGAFSNWAGYVVLSGVHTAAPITQVTTLWTEPNVRCVSNSDKMSIRVGIDGAPGPGDSNMQPMLDQPRRVNEPSMQAGASIDCTSGSPVHRGFWEIINPWAQGTHAEGPQLFGGPILPGDRMSAGVSSPAVPTDPESFNLVVNNVTRNWVAIKTVFVPPAQHASGEVVVSKSSCGPICTWPSFGAVFFDTATVNGQPIGSFRRVALETLDPRDNRVILPTFYDGNDDFAVWKP